MSSDKIDRIASELDEIAVALDDVKEQPCGDTRADQLARVEQALDRTAKLVEQLENKED